MSDHLCIQVTFLDGRFHGRGDGGEPEWPPSPLRLLQAIIAANADEMSTNESLVDGLEWLERQPPPMIAAPPAVTAAPHCLSVPNNNMDLVARAWSRGKTHGSGDANPATHRTMKTVHPTRFEAPDAVRFLWRIVADDAPSQASLDAIQAAVKRVYAVGWGVDLVVADAWIAGREAISDEDCEHWLPTDDSGTASLRTPTAGSCSAMSQRHASFLSRMAGGTLAPVEPLTAFNVTGYRRSTDPLAMPYRLFELRQPDGRWFRYPHRKLIHLAGMVRHLAIEAMTAAPPSDAPDGWVDTFVAGHNLRSTLPHQQLSYLPLPSIGTTHTDPGVRRFMLAAPVGCGAWLDHVARRLEYGTLQPQRGNEFHSDCTPMLVPVRSARGDGVTRCYTQASTVWHSFTPVILPGHDDHKPSKTRRLIGRALAQAGIESGCSFEWSPYPQFAKSFTAHKRDRRGRPQGYFRPDHLLTQTAVHLTLRFDDDLNVPGPLAIGAGRHCGLGLFAREPAR